MLQQLVCITMAVSLTACPVLCGLGWGAEIAPAGAGGSAIAVSHCCGHSALPPAGTSSPEQESGDPDSPSSLPLTCNCICGGAVATHAADGDTSADELVVAVPGDQVESHVPQAVHCGAAHPKLTDEQPTRSGHMLRILLASWLL